MASFIRVIFCKGIEDRFNKVVEKGSKVHSRIAVYRANPQGWCTSLCAKK